MKSLNKTLIGLLVGIFGLGLTSKTNAELYDNFNSGILDQTKWIELGDTLDQYYVDPTEGKYHTAQLTEADRVATLEMIRQFQPGEILEYDVDYNSGSGNLLSRIIVNGCDGDSCGLQSSQCEGQGYATGGAIGFWNGLSCVGENVKGRYHVKLSFSSDHVDISFTDPANRVITYSPMFSPISPLYTIRVQTRTGHNGIVHIDYDNFYVNGIDSQDIPATSPIGLGALALGIISAGYFVFNKRKKIGIY